MEWYVTMRTWILDTKSEQESGPYNSNYIPNNTRGTRRHSGVIKIIPKGGQNFRPQKVIEDDCEAGKRKIKSKTHPTYKFCPFYTKSPSSIYLQNIFVSIPYSLNAMATLGPQNKSIGIQVYEMYLHCKNNCLCKV